MKIIIEGQPKEIAALALELQGRRVVITSEDIIRAASHPIQVDLSPSVSLSEAQPDGVDWDKVTIPDCSFPVRPVNSAARPD